MAADTPAPAPTRHRPRSATVFVAAFVAGAAAAVGVNRALDVHLAQAKPQVECEPIFVALRSLPQGTPVTVWDVALRDWPKAMLPATALRVTDSFEGCLLKFPLREGQPLLAAQLLKAEIPAPAVVEPSATEVEDDLVEEAFVPPPPAEQPIASPTTAVSGSRLTDPISAAEPPGESATAEVTATTDVAPPSVEPPSAESSRPTVASQPTLATPPARETELAAISAATAPAIGDDQHPDSVDPAFDVPARPPVDLASIPSVMSRADNAETPAEDETNSAGNVRYLVVPERIARQADTSFTTPVAPEARPAAEPTPAAVESQAFSRADTDRRPQADAASRSRSPAVSSAPQRQRSAAGQSTASQSGRGKPQPQQGRQAQGNPQGRPQQSRAPTQPKPAASTNEQASPRAWGGMFPNVSAGLDALGAWRGRVREAGAPPRPASEPAPQRR